MFKLSYVSVLTVCLLGGSSLAYAEEDGKDMGRGKAAAKSESSEVMITKEKDQLEATAQKIRGLKRDLIEDIRPSTDKENVAFTDRFLKSGLTEINILQGYFDELSSEKKVERLTQVRDQFVKFKNEYLSKNLGKSVAQKYDSQFDNIIKRMNTILGEEKKLDGATGVKKTDSISSPVMEKMSE